MRRKALTMDCDTCELMKINSDNKFLCKWGKGEPKILEPHKGKQPLNCNLKR